MALQHFQSALAHLIRRPPESPDEMAFLFSEYELSQQEKKALEYFANDRLVKDFSIEMREKRWSAISRAINCLRPFIQQRKLKELLQEDFEAKHRQTPFVDISIAFLKYLAKDADAKKKVAKLTPEFFCDLTLYLYTVSYFSQTSAIAQSEWKIIELNYDVRELAEEIIEPVDWKYADYLAQDDNISDELLIDVAIDSLPVKRPLTVLFVADEIPTEFRSFEIDTEVKNFLLEPEQHILPPCYGDLVELGLCEPLSEAQRLAHDIRVRLHKDGLYHLKEGVSESLFKEVAAHLGTILATDDIKLRLSKRKLHSPEALEFHTDSYLSDINAWWCDTPAEIGGAMLLIDTAVLSEHFSEYEMALLTKLEMECPNRSHSKFYKRQLLTHSPNGMEVFYTPWLVVEPEADELKSLWRKFASYIEAKRIKSVVEVLFKQGDCLFINNKRVLHGRDSLHPDTKRHLKRLWISTQPVDARLLE